MTTTNTLLRQWVNGDTEVKIYSNGTKIRTGGENPQYPESIDLKITNQCHNRCNFCHENSGYHGEHADITFIQDLFRANPLVGEIAIGGGDPLLHDRLFEIMEFLSDDAGCIVNMTVNENCLDGCLVRDIWEARLKGILHGLGVSLAGENNIRFGKEELVEAVLDDNSVFHFIAGISTPQDVVKTLPSKSLVLGFKQYGRASDREIPDMRCWNYWLPSMLSRGNISFDSLALQQLKVRSLVSDEDWNTYYMGDDGQYTMYIDAVAQEYAVSSISLRKPCGNLTIEEMFADVRQQWRRNHEH